MKALFALVVIVSMGCLGVMLAQRSYWLAGGFTLTALGAIYGIKQSSN